MEEKKKCSLTIQVQEPWVSVIIEHCNNTKSLSVSFPKKEAIFVGQGRYGIGLDKKGDKKPYITVGDDGLVEVISEDVETNFTIPSEVAEGFIKHVKERVGNPVEQGIEFEQSGDPQQVGKRRKTRKRRQPKRIRFVY
jgi:hypothetical protein